MTDPLNADSNSQPVLQLKKEICPIFIEIDEKESIEKGGKAPEVLLKPWSSFLHHSPVTTLSLKWCIVQEAIPFLLI